MKRKEKNREMKEKIKKIEEDFLLKQEENKRLMKELKDVKINCENELKLLRNEKNVCQEENEFLKQKLDERTLQTYKSHQVNFEIFRGNVSFDSFILVWKNGKRDKKFTEFNKFFTRGERHFREKGAKIGKRRRKMATRNFSIETE